MPNKAKEPLRLYAVSLFMEADILNAGDNDLGGHSATVILARSIEEAAETAFKLAHDGWPLDEGWRKHCAVLASATEDELEQVMEAGFSDDLYLEEQREQARFELNPEGPKRIPN